MFQTLVLSVSYIFFCMLQLFHLYVSKAERVLHIGCAWEAADGAGNVQAAWAMSGAAQVTFETTRAHWWCTRLRALDVLDACLLPVRSTVRTLALGLDVQALASPF
jgi:hypothetical protein